MQSAFDVLEQSESAHGAYEMPAAAVPFVNFDDPRPAYGFNESVDGN